MLVVGSSQSRWAGSGIPRRARVSGTHRHVAQPGNKPQLSRGRSPTAARTLSRVDEDAPAAILSSGIEFMRWMLVALMKDRVT